MALLAIDRGHTIQLLLSTALMVLLIPGLALFHGDPGARKNVRSALVSGFLAFGIVAIQWVVLGYSLVFGDSHAGFIGGLELAGLQDATLASRDATAHVTHLPLVLYEGALAALAPSLLAVVLDGRLKRSTLGLLVVLWSTFVYDPIAHWMWGPDGWLISRGALDFAGGTAVQLAAGISLLVAACVLGKAPTSLGLTVAATHDRTSRDATRALLGAAILWVGWCGITGGAALAANEPATRPLVHTILAAVGGAWAWALGERLRTGQIGLRGLASGGIAGLVAITAAASFVSPLAAVAVGLLAGFACHGGVQLGRTLGLGEASPAIGMHGLGGALGALATGVFAQKAVNPAGADGLVTGNQGPLVIQIIVVVAIVAYAGGMSLVLLRLLDATVGLGTRGAARPLSRAYERRA
jgi:Amt family ammonium transporter